MTRIPCLVVGAVLFLATTGTADDDQRDRDTLSNEVGRFHNALGLITGRWGYHSQAFFHWRIANRTHRIKVENQTDQLLDELALAHAGTRQFAEAIRVAEEHLVTNSERYETVLILAKLQFRAGQFESSAKSAHRVVEFGPTNLGDEARNLELLSNYAQTKLSAGALNLPLSDEERSGYPESKTLHGFAAFLMANVKPTDVGDEANRTLTQDDVISKVIANFDDMLPSACHELPVAMEALGDLLIGHGQDAKQLAARAYLQAANHSESDETRDSYRKMAVEVLRRQGIVRSHDSVSLETVEAGFEQELAEALEAHREMDAVEAQSLAKGRDPEQRIPTDLRKLRQANRPAQRGVANRGAPKLMFVILIAVAIGLIRRYWPQGSKSE